jgi:hypothetical protein
MLAFLEIMRSPNKRFTAAIDCQDEIEGYGVFFACSDVQAPMTSNFSQRTTRTPYHCSLHSINVFWDTYRQYTPTRLFFSKPNQSLQSYEPTCVLRVQKELDRGAESHSGAETLFVQLSLCHHFGNMRSRQPHAPLQLNVRYYSTVWRFPPLIVHLQGCQHQLQIFPFLCATLYKQECLFRFMNFIPITSQFDKKAN